MIKEQGTPKLFNQNSNTFKVTIQDRPKDGENQKILYPKPQ